MSEDRCVVCGNIVPEGRQVCPNCMVTIKPDGIHELSKHQYELEERIPNCTVEILRCKVCGDISIGWYRGEQDG